MISRLALAGALAGLCAAALDFGLAHAGVGAFLPTGSWRLLAFLAGLYGVTGALAGTLIAIVAGGFREDAIRLVAWLAIAVPLLVGSGFAMRPIADVFFGQFHNHLLIAGVTGVTLAGFTLGIFGLATLVAPYLRFVRVGPVLVLSPPLALFPSLVFGLYVASALASVDVMTLFARMRMSNPTRALNVALAAPACALGGLVAGWLLLRTLSRMLARSSKAPASYTRVAVSTLAVLVVPLVLGAVYSWATVKQLDLRPFASGAVILLGLVVLVRVVGARPWLALGTVLVCCIAMLSLGRVPRVRKATSLTGLAPLLVQAIHAASDLDRDGYSSLLGGGDCDDLDASVHPGAFDWPDDGIDQDCNGHQATLADRATKVYADVPAAVPEKPNVLLITLDALRSDHVSAYGYARKTTPNLDALAADGIRFANAWSHAPSTRYSVPAILIGRYPSTIAVNPDFHVHWPPQVLPENRLVSEMLKDLGYHTGANLSYHYFERGWGLDQGFDDYDYHLYTLHSVGGDPAATSGTSSRELADLDIEWLKAHKDAPFFLWSHFYDTHFKFERHPDLPETDFGSKEEDLYDGEIRFADYHIGRVFQTLKDLGLWDKTIIIITSDHGDGFGEHGIPQSRRHGYHLYRTETSVPVLMHVPGLQPRVVQTPIGHVDLIPTLLNLLRRPATEEPQLLGQSLLAAMLGDDSKKDERAIYQEVWFEGPTSLKALATTKAHLIDNLVPEDTVELYDLQNDIREEHDLAGDGLALEASMQARLGAITDAIAIPNDFAQRLKDARGTSPTTPQIALGDELGDYATVTGVDFENARLHPRETAYATVHLAIDKSIPEGWLVFAHANGPRGHQMNLDHAPLENLVPLQSLKAGEHIKDPIAISIPADWPPGPVQLELGLYRRGQRAKVKGAHNRGDAVQLGTIDVLPAEVAPGEARP